MKGEPQPPPGDVAGGAPVSWPFVAAAAALLVMFALYLALRIPIGIPGEWWTFYHVAFAGAGQVAWYALVLAAFLAAAFVFDRIAARVAALTKAALAAALTAGYAFVIFSTATCGPYDGPEFVVPAFEFGACGLFKREAAKVADPRQYLEGFPARLREYAKDYKLTVRVNNNPPGTTMAFYAMEQISRKYPALADMASTPVFGSAFVPPNTAFATSILGAWLLLAGAALAFVPAYLVASNLLGRSAFFPAAVAMFAGSMLLFNPGNDTLQVFVFLWMAYFHLKALEGRRAVWGAAMGLAAAAGFFFSLATAVVVVVLFFWSITRWLSGGLPALRSDIAFWAASAGGLLAGFGVLYLAAGYNSFATLLECYRNHGLFYQYFPRTYWKWLLYNPFEFAFFTGGPLSVAIGWYAIRRPVANLAEDGAARSRAARGCVIATLVVMLLLNLSGKNSSEIDRLWVFFMPLLALPAVCLVRDARKGLADLVVLAALQAANVILLRVFVDVWRTEPFFKDIAKYMGSGGAT